jgi:hypothetical protein
MAFALSPSVTVVEKDFTSIVPAVSTSTGAFAGVFQWGPVLDPVTVTSENVLIQRFGRPNDENAQSWFTAANFLSYTSNLILTRVDTAGSKNAVATLSGSIASVEVTDGGTGYTTPVVTFSAPDVFGGVQATGTAVVEDGEIVSITITNPGSGYVGAPTISFDSGDAEAEATLSVGVKIKNQDEYDTLYANGAGVYGPWAAKYPGTLGNSVGVSMADAVAYNQQTGGSFVWPWRAEFDSAPGTTSYTDGLGGSNDELHIVVYDADGGITGTVGAILEKFSYVSKASDARKSDGANNYYKDVINAQSRYIWWMDHVPTSFNWGTQAQNTDYDTLTTAYTVQLSGAADDFSATDGNLMEGFSLFANDELYDISLIPVGKASDVVAEYVINNVAEVRRDCVAFISPEYATGSSMGIEGDIIIGTTSEAIEAINEYRDALPSTSYAVMDSGYKYQYDRYNDKYRWVPLNGDIAGLCARTDYTNDPWWSPGGLNRGQIKNVVKLAVNPGKVERDNLYKNGVNPVVSFPGQGVVLYGDKTLLARPSAFDRINVRRLFIVLEKAIATAAKFQLFEFNDSFTRAQFKALVEPFLRDVQGRRGVIDFRVKCDEQNNTGEVIDRNEFVADIFIKPNRSINFITLNFIAARTSVSFEEIGA